MTRACATSPDVRIALTLTATLHPRSHAQAGCTQGAASRWRGHREHDRPGHQIQRPARRRPPAARQGTSSARNQAPLGDAVGDEAHGLYAYPRRLCLWNTEPFEDVQRLPKYDPRCIGALRVERRFCDSLEDLGLLVRVTDLPGQPQSGVVMIKRLVVLARSATHVSYPAKCDHLLGQIPDLLRDQSRLLVIN